MLQEVPDERVGYLPPVGRAEAPGEEIPDKAYSHALSQHRELMRRWGVDAE